MCVCVRACILAPVLGPHGLGSLPGRRKDTAVFSRAETNNPILYFLLIKKKNSADEPLTLSRCKTQ